MNKKNIAAVSITIAALIIGVLGFVAFGLFKQNQILRGQQEQITNTSQQNAATSSQIAQTSPTKQKSGLKPVVLPPTQSSQNQTITSQDIAPYLGGVGSVFCWDDSGNLIDRGSGSLKKVSTLSSDGVIKTNYFILTNKHVLGSNNCTLAIDQDFYRNTMGGQYQLFWIPRLLGKTGTADAVEVGIDFALSSSSDAISALNYSIGNLRHCTGLVPVGSSVYIIGYPAFGESTVDAAGNRSANKLATAGTISGYSGYQTSPSVNYFVTAQMDAGNSGGAAIARDTNGLCFLGIPTWVNQGEYANTGMVQNINNL